MKLIEQFMKIFLNSFFEDTIRKDKDYKHEDKNERWMETEYDDRVEKYHKMKNGGFFIKIEKLWRKRWWWSWKLKIK